MNAPPPSSVMLSGKVTSIKLTQERNTPMPMLRTAFGIEMERRLVHWEKTSFSICLTDEGMTMFGRLVQLLNVPSLSTEMPLPSVTLVKLVHDVKAPVPILETLSGVTRL